MIDQDLSHQTCGHAEEMRPVCPGRILPVDQSKVDLVDERGGLQRVARVLAPEIAAGQAGQFCGNEWRKPVERTLIAAPPGAQQLRDLGWRGFHGAEAVIVIVLLAPGPRCADRRFFSLLHG